MWSRDRSSLKGTVPNFKRAGKHNVLSCSLDSAKLNPKYHCSSIFVEMLLYSRRMSN